MKLVSRASRPGLTVGFLRIPCNGLCTAQKMYILRIVNIRVVLDARMNPTLSHYNECPRLYDMFRNLCGDRLLCYHGEAIFSMT